MREHLGFLKISSLVVKIAAWVFLSLGLIGGVSVMLGLVPGNPRWMGGLVLAMYVFFFSSSILSRILPTCLSKLSTR